MKAACLSWRVWCLVLVTAGADLALSWSQSNSARAPYPASAFISGMIWHWETRVTAAPGSDLWPVTWGPDDNLYTAWGDGGGFGGTDSDGRVALGFGRIEGSPEYWRGVNVNGGKNPENSPSFPLKGKTTGLVCVDGTLYATLNLEDASWPDVTHALAWSTNKGATWLLADWRFPKGPGQFQPAKFVSFGKDYSGLPRHLGSYVYLCGPKQCADRGSGSRLYLARVPRNQLRNPGAYSFFQGLDRNGKPTWNSQDSGAEPIFTDLNGVTPGAIIYVSGLKRFLLTCFHSGPGQLGVFEGPNLWGPWKTVGYYENWGEMGTQGEGLTCGFVPKWIAPDGRTLWAIFAVYGEGAKKGINAHDKFNLMKVSLQVRGAKNSR